MITINGFSNAGNWYKGNLHSHTTVSDGNFTPEQAVKEFKQHGYSFLCISDHNIFSDYRGKLDEEDFLLLPGVEAAAVLFDDADQCKKVHHINGILGTSEMQKQAQKLFEHMEPVKPLIFYGEWDGAKVADQMMMELRNRGCFVTYNHPVWSRVEAKEFMNTEEPFILEIFNYNTQNESGTGYDTASWDTMLRSGKKVLADASDDNHNDGVFDDAFGGYIVVKAESLTHDDIIKSIISGNYYSSSGPEIDRWEINHGIAYISCSASERITFFADGFVGAGTTYIARSNDSLLQEARFPLTGKESYIRAECRALDGKKAWTNPIYLRHLGKGEENE